MLVRKCGSRMSQITPDLHIERAPQTHAGWSQGPLCPYKLLWTHRSTGWTLRQPRAGELHCRVQCMHACMHHAPLNHGSRVLLFRYEAVSAHQAELDKPYTALAALLNCKASNIALLGSATHAWVQVLNIDGHLYYYCVTTSRRKHASPCMQVFFGLPFTEGDRILTSVIEYGSNYIAYLQVCKTLQIATTTADHAHCRGCM